MTWGVSCFFFGSEIVCLLPAQENVSEDADPQAMLFSVVRRPLSTLGAMGTLLLCSRPGEARLNLWGFSIIQ